MCCFYNQKVKDVVIVHEIVFLLKKILNIFQSNLTHITIINEVESNKSNHFKKSAFNQLS